jgi:hypothetical protein
VAPQLIDVQTGDLKDDPDSEALKLNSEPLYRLKEGLSHNMSEGDTISMETI